MIRVLIIDDDFMVARVHQTYVDEIPNFTVVGFAHTGKEAIERAGELQPDLVLLDIYLPDANGLDLLGPLREAAPELDVFVISAARDVDSAHKALRAGITQYLIKPFSFEDLRDRLIQYQRGVQAITALGGEASQEDLDRIFGIQHTHTNLPKGLSQETLRLVRATLNRGNRDFSAGEMAQELEMSRGSARRYLEYLASTTEANVRLKYGEVGRPERRYAARGTTSE